MNTINTIKEQFGEEEIPFLYSRMEYMSKPVRQEFIDACVKWNTRPSAGWNGGFFGDPFIPVKLTSEREYGTST